MYLKPWLCAFTKEQHWVWKCWHSFANSSSLPSKLQQLHVRYVQQMSSTLLQRITLISRPYQHGSREQVSGQTALPKRLQIRRNPKLSSYVQYILDLGYWIGVHMAASNGPVKLFGFGLWILFLLDPPQHGSADSIDPTWVESRLMFEGFVVHTTGRILCMHGVNNPIVNIEFNIFARYVRNWESNMTTVKKLTASLLVLSDGLLQPSFYSNLWTHIQDRDGPKAVVNWTYASIKKARMLTHDKVCFPVCLLFLFFCDLSVHDKVPKVSSLFSLKFWYL